MNANRKRELRTMLEERRRELGDVIVQKIRNIRTKSFGQKSGKISDVMDILERADANVQDDIELILIELSAAKIRKIDEALDQLGQGIYGYCSECGSEISEKRLRALPFAVRCKDCEEACEFAEQHKRLPSRRRSLGPLFDSSDSFDPGY